MSKICIVDDDQALRNIFVQWLKRSKTVEFGRDYANAIDASEGLPKDKPDIVLMDINMPGMDGIECVQRLKDILPQTLFLMLTVFEDDDKIFSALSVGACGYLLKQTTEEQLDAALKSALSGGSPMSDSIARKVVRSFQTKSLKNDPDQSLRTTLSTREHEILELLATGWGDKQIADKVELSKHTVNTYLRRIYEKLHVHTRSQAVTKYHEHKRSGPFTPESSD
ncbi:MAG: response regulator transcription factor [bacterium]